MERTLSLSGGRELLSLSGASQRHLKLLQEAFNIEIVARGDTMKLIGDDANTADALKVCRHLSTLLARKGSLEKGDVEHAVRLVKTNESMEIGERVEVMVDKRFVAPQTAGQREYVQAVMTHDVVFCIGPSGTGKTYLAVALATNALKKRLVKKIVLARPAVEAGEKLGYLPGDLEAKVSPYLRPLYDALGDMMEFTQIRKFMDNDMIEVIPLAFMRGRTLNEGFIILDEAQNSTAGQMKMFLTRLGRDSKIIVNGDITQVDLPPGEVSGLIHAREVLKDVAGIKFVTLGARDIVRHKLVSDIVNAYAAREER